MPCSRWLHRDRNVVARKSLFAVGDVRPGSIKRVASAVAEGSGAIAAVRQLLAH